MSVRELLEREGAEVFPRKQRGRHRPSKLRVHVSVLLAKGIEVAE